jgi:hypothetical protein
VGKGRHEFGGARREVFRDVSVNLAVEPAALGSGAGYDDVP